MIKILPYFVALTCLACAGEKGPSASPGPQVADSVRVAEADAPEKDPFRDSLRAYFEAPVDFYALKKQTMHMHTGSSNWKKEYFHVVDDPDAQFYGYWAVEFDLKTVPMERSLLFATWKPWRTPQQRSYETDNETLVGIHSQVEWDGLGPSNFVGQPLDAVRARFGEPQGTRETVVIYTLDDKLLLLNESAGRVNWFKYYWWYEPVTMIDSLPGPLFTWSDR